MRRATVLLALAVAVAAGACASSGAGVRGGDPDIIAQSELLELQDLNGLEVIRRLRPAWLRRRTAPGPVAQGAGDAQMPVLHIDGSRQRDLEVLEMMQARDISEIRFLDSSAATTRFGTGYSNGAILVTTHH